MAADNGFPNGCVVSVDFNVFCSHPQRRMLKNHLYSSSHYGTEYLKVVIVMYISLLLVNRK
jgi:hypothetical protein